MLMMMIRLSSLCSRCYLYQLWVRNSIFWKDLSHFLVQLRNWWWQEIMRSPLRRFQNGKNSEKMLVPSPWFPALFLLLLFHLVGESNIGLVSSSYQG